MWQGALTMTCRAFAAALVGIQGGYDQWWTGMVPYWVGPPAAAVVSWRKFPSSTPLSKNTHGYLRRRRRRLASTANLTGVMPR